MKKWLILCLLCSLSSFAMAESRCNGSTLTIENHSHSTFTVERVYGYNNSVNWLSAFLGSPGFLQNIHKDMQIQPGQHLTAVARTENDSTGDSRGHIVLTAENARLNIFYHFSSNLLGLLTCKPSVSIDKKHAEDFNIETHKSKGKPAGITVSIG